MKIAQIVCTFPPYQAGMGNVAFYLSKYLAKKGHEVTVFTPDYTGKKYTEDSSYGFEVKRLKPLFKYGNAAFIPQIAWQLKGFDIIHLHYAFYGVAEILWFLGKGTKKHLLIQYHNDVLGQGFLKLFFTLHNRWLMPQILKCARQLIVPSESYVQGSLLNQVIKKKKINFVSLANGVDQEIFYPKNVDEEIFSKYGIRKNEKIILFVGNMDKAHYQKGVEYLIRALKIIIEEKKLNNIKLVLVGEGELKEQYQNLAENLGLKDKVIFTGAIGHDKLNDFYNLCNFFVLPSFGIESFGIVLIEAMACKKPVIASQLPGAGIVFTNGKEGFYCQQKNAEELSEKMYSLLTNDELTQKMGENGLQKVKEQYTWEKITEKLLDIYAQIIN